MEKDFLVKDNIVFTTSATAHSVLHFNTSFE